MNLFVMLSLRKSPPAVNPVLVEMFDLLARQGFDVEVGIGDDFVVAPDTIVPRHTLYILKSHSCLWLSVAGVLHDAGARLLNEYPACAATQNKIIAAQRLRAAGIPVPRCWVSGDPRTLPERAGPGPFILKPYNGGRGIGIELARDRDELAAIPATDRPFLIQEYFAGIEDLKVYVVGCEVFAFRAPTFPATGRLPLRAVPLTDEIRDIALGCGSVFGLRLYGLDLVEGPNGPLVVDVNYFPSYRGVEHASGLLADYIGRYARAAVHELEPDAA